MHIHCSTLLADKELLLRLLFPIGHTIKLSMHTMLVKENITLLHAHNNDVISDDHWK